MIKIESIERGITPAGLNTWKPAVIINMMEEGKETTVNDIIEAVRELWLKNVVVIWRIEVNPEIRVVLVGLSGIGYTITYLVDHTEDISTLRSVRNLNFVVFTRPPSPERNEINNTTFNLLKNWDQIKILIPDEESFNNALSFLKAKAITRPTIIFDPTWGYREEFTRLYLEKVPSLKLFDSSLSVII